MPKPGQPSQIVQIAPFRDGVLALDNTGRLWFGISNYGSNLITTTNPTLQWLELTTPDLTLPTAGVGGLPALTIAPPKIEGEPKVV